ncbi:hypothetical protein DFP73DRAFT_267898 [Morchella snyderi]|nr:hypothetical protein DFP73DRAFT_267898 [Morchella snyderi]
MRLPWNASSLRFSSSLDGVRCVGYVYFLTCYLLTSTIILERPPPRAPLPGTKERESELRGRRGGEGGGGGTWGILSKTKKVGEKNRRGGEKRLGIVLSSRSFGSFVLFYLSFFLLSLSLLF